MSNEAKSGSWWHTLPGMLTAIATMLTAITGLVVAFSQAGLIPRDDKPDIIGDDPRNLSDDPADAGNTAQGNTRGQKSSGLIIGKVNQRTSAIHGIDDPLPTAIGTTYKLTLDAEEESYFRFTAPGPLALVLDMRLPDNEHSNLQNKVLLLDADGAPVGNALLQMNEIDVGHRAVIPIRLKPGAVAGLKLLNGRKLADFWLTLLAQPATQFVRLFGETVPQTLKPRQPASGSLGADEYAYFTTSLGAGTYKIILDFANAEGRNTNIQGYLALLDESGGNQKIVMRLNEIDVSYRKTETLTLTRAQTLIVRIFNDSHAVNFRVQIVAA